MKVSIKRPFDAHVHLRGGEMMAKVARYTSDICSYALVMPNVPTIETAEQARQYNDKIREVIGWKGPFGLLHTIKLTHRTTPKTISECISHPFIVAAKLYPSGVTTASHDGIQDIEKMVAVFEKMQSGGMVLCVHGEDPNTFILDRERSYLDKIRWITKNFPGLKVVLEHITTEDSVRFVQESSVNVAATITAHHLVITLDNVLGCGGIRPHNFCYPVAKRPEDRRALISAAMFENDGRFFFGSDSAPHSRENKESSCGCAGVFSAPVMMPVLAEVFLRTKKSRELLDSIGSTDMGRWKQQLEDFTCNRALKFYGLPSVNDHIILNDETPWRVPPDYDGIVPFRAGEILEWSVEIPPKNQA